MRSEYHTPPAAGEGAASRKKFPAPVLLRAGKVARKRTIRVQVFFRGRGKGALPAGKTGVARWNVALFSLLPQGGRSKRWALPIRKPRGIFSFKRECPPPAPLKRNVGTPPYTVTAIRFPALPGRQSCRFLESGPLYPPQAALGPLSPHPSWHKGAGCGPPLWKPLRGRGRSVQTAMQTPNPPAGCAERCSSQNCIPAFGGAVFTGVQIGRPLM